MKNKSIIISLLITLFLSLTSVAYSAESFKNLDANQVKEALEKGVVVIDSRGGKYFDGEIIKGAKFLPVTETNEETLKNIAGEDKNAPIIFYCTDTKCAASELAAYKAKEAGYNNISKYPEGIEDWKAKNLPTEKIKVSGK